MIFATRIAKLGKAKNINCNQVSSLPIVFNVYLSNNFVMQKTLDYQQNNYLLSKPITTYNYAEVLGINQNFVLARNGEYFSLLQV